MRRTFRFSHTCLATESNLLLDALVVSAVRQTAWDRLAKVIEYIVK